MSEFSDAMLPVIQQPLTDIWDATIGSWIGFWADKKRLDRQLKFEDYKRKILTECGKIPDDKRQEPQLSIIGPALEASKFYIDEEVLRDMFAKLIANSMNADKQQFINSAFVEIIKQMSPLDAQILKTFLTEKQQAISAFVEYVKGQSQQTQKKEYFILENVIYTIPGIDTLETFNNVTNSISINNLARLGLVEYSISRFGESLVDDSVYALHKDILEKTVKTEHPDADIIKGMVKITPLGTAFIESCLR